MEDAVKIFRMVATEFEALDDDTVKSWIDLTAPLISQKVFGKLYAQALALLTAHRLKMAGQGNNQYGTVGDSLRIGSYTEGSTSISFTAKEVPDSLISMLSSRKNIRRSSDVLHYCEYRGPEQ